MAYFSPLLLSILLLAGCSSYQPVKNVWKDTKSLWNTYVSPPASVDFDEKGDLSPQGLALTQGMMGIDVELSRLERTMLNADKPPTNPWIANFLTEFPWLNGVAGVKYDGTILGQEPANALKPIDFIPLLYEDKKQSTRALRADAQNTPLGPEVILAVPLYDGVDFLGIVAAHFDMRTLMQYSKTPENIVILSPYALLWPGKYDFAATPLAGVKWEEVVLKSSSGTCSNATGKFYYLVRYLGNLPLIFAVPQSGNFPEGNGDVTQGLAFFPKEREKLPPPPQPERKQKSDTAVALGREASQAHATSVDIAVTPTPSAAVTPTPGRSSAGASDIQPGSNDSLLLKKKKSDNAGMRERQLEGENVQVKSVLPPRKAPQKAEKIAPPKGLGLPPDPDMPTLSGGRPSPFGPREDANEAKDSSVAPVKETGAPAAEKASAAPATQEERPSVQPPAVLPGGRPSPFGPREDSAKDVSETPAKPLDSGKAAAEPSAANGDQNAGEPQRDRPSTPDADAKK